MSNINPQNIDGTFPIAGQDNNSQGFRDNFTNTINNFTFAAAELTDLQTYAVLKGPLGSVGQTGTPTNDMNYAYLTAAQLKKAVETVNPIGNVSSGGSYTLDWSAGHFQTVGVTGSATLGFASTWPATNYWTKLRLRVDAYGSTLVTFPATVTENITNIQGYQANTSVLLSGGVYVFEFTTYNNGSTVAIEDVLRNYSTNAASFSSLTVSGNITAVGGNIGLITFYNNTIHSTQPTVDLQIGRLTSTANLVINRTTVSNKDLVVFGSVTANTAVSGNATVIDPIGAGSFGSNLTVKGTIHQKWENYTANVTTSSRTLNLVPGGDGYVFVKTTGNLAITYGATIVPGSKIELSVWTTGGNAWVNLPNANTPIARGNVFVLNNSYTRFVFTAFGTDNANVVVSTDGRA